jgi:serine/threonine protein kinase/tetratricopeptide (TPR) repeat protein
MATSREEEIFAEAIQKASPKERAAYLDQACGDDEQLRSAVQALLEAYENPDSLFAAAPGAVAAIPGQEVAATLEESLRECVGMEIGPYKLLQQLGEGGMGTVFLAQQSKPVERVVAIKVIKPGMDSRQVIARFEAERQALAMMDHPNIAKVLDAGTTQWGRPYFVMELVKGMPITKYCDHHRLSTRERLDLFLPVCQAIQHAHQKGIIHRDVKPSNVMVAMYDGKPVPKVIDFGVAKATGSRLTERTLYTAIGAVVGTFEYMSPEQAELNQLDVDTRTDIYSLGVLLYELLTGSTPLEHHKLREMALLELLRAIREVDPPKPSTRVSESGESLPSICAMRHVEPKKLGKLLRGELDWIVMKALEKDRTRRYETANGFASDVKRYLEGDAVQACPPSATYRFRKFARRNRVAITTAGLVAAALVLGSVVSTWQAVRAEMARADERQQRLDADAARRVAVIERGIAAQAARAETEARLLAETERTKAQAAAEAESVARKTAEAREAETSAVLDFVQNKVFAAARPQGQDGGLGHEVRLRDAIFTALPFVETSFPDQPLIEARLRNTLGLSFAYLGEAEIGRQQFQRARDLYTSGLGPDHPQTLRSMSSLANSYFALGRREEALQLNLETLALRKAKLGTDHRDTLMSMNNLANSYFALGRREEALQLREETLSLQKAKLGLDHPDTLTSMNKLSSSY